jgi:hypothetical protein
VIKQEQEDMRYAELAELTTRKTKKKFQDVLNAIGDSLTNRTSSDNAKNPEDVEDNDTHTVLGNLSDDGKPGWVMGRITGPVLQCMVNVLQIQIKLIELLQLDGGIQPTTFLRGTLSTGLRN